MTKKQKKELDNLAKVIMTEADIVRQDYEDNPSDMDSGSIVAIHQDSPLLDDVTEELSDIAYNITRKSSSINDWGDDEWATPSSGDKK
jgi:hypothetical protein